MFKFESTRYFLKINTDTDVTVIPENFQGSKHDDHCNNLKTEQKILDSGPQKTIHATTHFLLVWQD